MIKYIAYCRKSTDEKDKQVLSIEAQITELKVFAKREGLNVTEFITEAKTAKVPGRGQFELVLKKIEKGEANGILSWHPDRLARNMMEGGEINFRGMRIVVDKNLSNPKNIGYPDYFTTDAIKDIPPDVKKQWPQEYVSEIARFESFADVSARMADTLRRLKKIGDKKYRVILVSHDAMVGALVKTLTSGQSSGINPAQFLTIERQGDKLVVTAVGDLTEGDNQTDVAPSQISGKKS